MMTSYFNSLIRTCMVVQLCLPNRRPRLLQEVSQAADKRAQATWGQTEGVQAEGVQASAQGVEFFREPSRAKQSQAGLHSPTRPHPSSGRGRLGTGWAGPLAGG